MTERLPADSVAECQHITMDWGSNYLGHAHYAEGKAERGEKQRRCPVCRRFFWTSEWKRTDES
jgi:hypothetical protein